MDTITLLRTIKDEHTPRVYTMTGGEFEPMKDAVKALGGKFTSTPFACWKTTAEINASLKEQGFLIEKQPDFSINLTEIPSILTSVRDHEYVQDVSFGLRNSDGSSAASNISGRCPATLHIFVSEGYIQAYLPILAARYKEIGYSFEPKPRDVIADTVKRVRALFAIHMESIFEWHTTTSRTLEDFKAGVAAVKAAIESEENTFFAATVIDGKPIILAGHDPEAKRIKQENDILEQQKKEASDKAREEKRAERIATAPKYVEEWFGRLNKAEIAERLQSLAQFTLDSKQKKMTKVQLIAFVVADRDLCEKLIQDTLKYV